MRHALRLMVLAGSMAVVAGPVLACSFAPGSQDFRPTLQRFEPRPLPPEQGYYEKIPAPIVTIDKVTRGKAAPGASCDDAGILELSVALPQTSSYRLDQFGVYFRVLDGQQPDAIFPNDPLTNTIKDGKVSMFFVWLDGHPSRQKPLDLKVEAFLVTNGLNIGPSTVFEVKASVGQR